MGRWPASAGLTPSWVEFLGAQMGHAHRLPCRGHGQLSPLGPFDHRPVGLRGWFALRLSILTGLCVRPGQHKQTGAKRCFCGRRGWSPCLPLQRCAGPRALAWGCRCSGANPDRCWKFAEKLFIGWDFAISAKDGSIQRRQYLGTAFKVHDCGRPAVLQQHLPMWDGCGLGRAGFVFSPRLRRSCCLRSAR